MDKHKRHYIRMKERAIVFLGGECARCHTTHRLEFDHIVPETKTVNVTVLFTGGWERIMTELYKCQLLCHDCHVDKTREGRVGLPGGRKGKITHGTSGYRTGCRCGVCKTLYSKSRKERYKRLRT